MKKEYHIKKASEIDKIIKARKSVGNSFFVIYQLKNSETEHFRFALSIGKKYGDAVSRNLMKRRVREIIRNNVSLLEKKDYVVVIKPKANTLDFQTIEKIIIGLIKREVN